MRVLVTGATGMLGSALLRHLHLSSNHEIFGLSRQEFDLEDIAKFSKVLESFSPDVVVHTAAKVGGLLANINNPVAFLASNISVDTNVITACLEHEVKNFVYFGSSCMYPKTAKNPLVETDILGGPLESTNEGYALAKIAGSKLCEYASNAYGLNYRTIIPSNLYGPGDNFHPNSSHLIASIIRKVHHAKMTRANEIQVWGSGTARREFTYIDDLAVWLVDVLQNLNELPTRLNVGWGSDYSVKEFYLAALETMGVQVELKYDLTKPDGISNKLMDSSLARQNFSWNPKFDIHEGIETTYAWYLENVSE